MSQLNLSMYSHRVCSKCWDMSYNNDTLSVAISLSNQSRDGFFLQQIHVSIICASSYPMILCPPCDTHKSLINKHHLWELAQPTRDVSQFDVSHQGNINAKSSPQWQMALTANLHFSPSNPGLFSPLMTTH